MAYNYFLKPDFYLDAHLYGWVTKIGNKKVAQAIWKKRFNRLFDISISGEWWHNDRMARIVEEMYLRTAALAYPELLSEYGNPYCNPDQVPGVFGMIVSNKKVI